MEGWMNKRLTDMQLLRIKNGVMRILHVPGNYAGGILEMAIVVDYHVPKEEIREMSYQIADTLKHQNETFRNVRLNLVKWISDEQIIKEISSLTSLQMGRGYDDHGQTKSSKEKTLDELLRQLKLFYARSKIVIVLTDGSYQIKEEDKIEEYLNPFLRRKLLMIQPPAQEQLSQVCYVEI